MHSARTRGQKDTVGQRAAWGDTMKQDTETNCNVVEEFCAGAQETNGRLAEMGRVG